MATTWLVRVAARTRLLFCQSVAILAWVAVIGNAQPAAASEPNVSGTYVSTSPRLVEMIFIVQTPDRKLTGRWETKTLDANGLIQTASVTVEGVTDGSSLVLTPRSILLALGNPPSFSGLVSGDALDLSWESGHRTYHRGTSENFRADVAEMVSVSNQLVAQANLGRAVTDRQQLAQMMNVIESGLPAVRGQLAQASDRYRDLYGRMHNRRRAQAIQETIPGHGLDAMRSGTDAQSYGLEIDATNLEVARLNSGVHGQFQSARSLAASVATYCATTVDAPELAPCADMATQQSRLEGLRAEAQGYFDAVQGTARDASVDVPPGRRWIENMRRN